eukprot:TRINITY_DN10055_c0_g2_i1.p1 TRINITY_DN10055_c0_g2~~TRINITY_DN10055_c0_g2_i1.p1  ORF type:complete len:237 (+),score=45.54 TRINITY_DN10055_c0_g2_i1:49-711(+)
MVQDGCYKVVFLGDSAVGKTCFAIRCCHDTFPMEYIPTIMDTEQIEIEIGPYASNNKKDKDGAVAQNDMKKTAKISLWETGSRGDYEEIRPLTYPNTDLFFLFYSVISRISLDNIVEKYHPEITSHCPKTPFFLIGLKQDLREDEEIITRLKEKGTTPVDPHRACKIGHELQAAAQFVCSSKTGEGCKEILKATARFLTLGKEGLDFMFKKRKVTNCILM